MKWITFSYNNLKVGYIHLSKYYSFIIDVNLAPDTIVIPLPDKSEICYTGSDGQCPTLPLEYDHVIEAERCNRSVHKNVYEGFLCYMMRSETCYLYTCNALNLPNINATSWKACQGQMCQQYDGPTILPPTEEETIQSTTMLATTTSVKISTTTTRTTSGTITTMPLLTSKTSPTTTTVVTTTEESLLLN